MTPSFCYNLFFHIGNNDSYAFGSIVNEEKEENGKVAEKCKIKILPPSSNWSWHHKYWSWIIKKQKGKIKLIAGFLLSQSQ